MLLTCVRRSRAQLDLPADAGLAGHGRAGGRGRRLVRPAVIRAFQVQNHLRGQSHKGKRAAEQANCSGNQIPTRNVKIPPEVQCQNCRAGLVLN